MCTHLKIVPPVLSLFSFNNNKIKTKGLLWIRQVLSFIFMGDKTTGDIAWKIVRTDNPWKRRENFFSSIFFSRLKKYDWTSPWSMAMGIFRATFKKKNNSPPLRSRMIATDCVCCVYARFVPSFFWCWALTWIVCAYHSHTNATHQLLLLLLLFWKRKQKITCAPLAVGKIAAR